MILINTFYRLLLVTVFVLLSSFCKGQDEFKSMINRYFSKYYSQSSGIKVYLHTDKYLYETGENVWITALVADRYENQVFRGNMSLSLKLFNENGIEVWQKSLQPEDGLAATTIPLRDYFKEGIYFLKAYAGKSPKVLFQQEISVKKYAVPFHLMNIDFTDKFYAGGEKITISLSATDYFKNPLKGASYNCTLYNGGKIAYTDRGRLNKTGDAYLTFNLPDPISRDGLKLQVTVEEKKLAETLVVPVPAQLENLQVEFFPEGGSLVIGIPNFLTIKAWSADGEDFSFSGVVINEKEEIIKEVVNNEAGAAVFTYTPVADERLTLRILSPYPLNRTFELPEPATAGATLSFLPDSAGMVRLKTSKYPHRNETFYFGVSGAGEMYEMQKLSFGESHGIKLRKSALKPGINRFTLFNSALKPVSEVLRYFSEPVQSPVEAAFSKESFNNRERVTLEIKHTEGITYAFSAVDEYRLLRPGKTPSLLSHFAVGAELQGFPALKAEDFNEPEELEAWVNSLLGYSVLRDTWHDIYKINNKENAFQQYSQDKLLPRAVPSANYGFKSHDHILYTNYPHSNYYLANNPVLIEKLNEEKKVIKQEPFYKEQLRNGVSLREVIHNMKQYTVMDNKIVFGGSMNSFNNQGGALIILDGTRLGENITALDHINPFDIDEIFISTNPVDIHSYTGLNSVGIIDIKTKRGGNQDRAAEKEFDETFKSPDHSKEKNDGPDLRTTIYYTPFAPETETPVSVSFYHSDVRTNVVGRLEGFDNKGNVFYREVYYSSFNYSEENQ